MTKPPLPLRMNLETAAICAFRVGYSMMVLVFHGWHKLPEAFRHLESGDSWKLAEEIDAMGLPFASAQAVFATVVQVATPILLAAGLWTRMSSLLLALVLAGAVAQNVSADRDPQLALLYLIVAIFFSGFGPGPWSLDAKRKRNPS